METTGRSRTATDAASGARQVYERHVAAFNAHDADADPWSAEAEFIGPDVQLRGGSEVLGFLRAWWDAFPDARNEVRRLVVDGSAVAAEGIFSGTHTGNLRTAEADVAATGRSVALRWSAICETSGDELTSEHLYFDQLALLSQLGLAPASA